MSSRSPAQTNLHSFADKNRKLRYSFTTSTLTEAHTNLNLDGIIYSISNIVFTIPTPFLDNLPSQIFGIEQ